MEEKKEEKKEEKAGEKREERPSVIQGIPTQVVNEAIDIAEVLPKAPTPKPTTMRIPHTIPEVALRTYEPSRAALTLPDEQGRPLRAEDFGWDAAVPQPLSHWCVLSIVDNFKDRPLLHSLPPQDRDHVLEKIPTDLPLEVTVPKVPDGFYWRRCCEDKWQSMNYVDEYSNSWKRMFLERYLEEHLEGVELDDYEPQEAGKLAKLIAPHVLRLRLRQLQVGRSLEELEAIQYEKTLEERTRIEDEEEVIEVEDVERPKTPDEMPEGKAAALIMDIFFPGRRQELEERFKKKKKKKKKKKAPPPPEPEPEPEQEPEAAVESEEEDGWPADWKDPCVPRADISLSHINLQPVLQALVFLQELSIVFGVRTTGMQFRWEMFLFSREDIRNITQGIKDLRHLSIFRLTRSTLDDKLGPELVRGLAPVKRLEILDLSHCRISDRTACALGQLLRIHPRIEFLDLTNNCIGEEGVRGLAYALRRGTKAPLDKLFLRLNRIGDGGAEALASALERSMKPSIVNLAACGIGEIGAHALSRALKQNRSLRSLDLSNNPLGEAGGEHLAHGMAKNSTLVDLDLRMTNITPLKEFTVLMQVEGNKSKIHKISEEIKDMLKGETIEEYDRTLEERAQEAMEAAEAVRRELEEVAFERGLMNEQRRRKHDSVFDFSLFG